MKRFLSLITALLLLGLYCCSVLSEEAASSGSGTLRKSNLWAGFYSFPVLRSGLTDLFWAVQQTENPHAKASLTEGEWNEITDISVLSGMKELRSLGLWNNQISDITPLSGLKELRTLDVSGNQLTDASVCGELPELTELWVRRNRIQDLSFTDRLEDLRVLMAGENPVTEYGRLKIRANDLSFTDLTE